MEKEKLFIDINGPTLLATRYIYACQPIENGVQFGIARNRYNSNICKIIKNNNFYSIIFMKLTKPKYNHNTREMIAHKKQVKFQLEGLNVEEVSTILNESFK